VSEKRPDEEVLSQGILRLIATRTSIILLSTRRYPFILYDSS